MTRTTTSEVQSVRVEGGTSADLRLTAGNLEIPAVLLLPAVSPAPAVLLLHGYSSRKEIMADSIGRALLRRGVASLSVDLPYHGVRGNPFELQSLRSPLEFTRVWRQALSEGRAAAAFLREHAHVQPGRVGVAGYSLGSYLALMLAADQPDLSPVALTAGGDLPGGHPLMRVARTVVDPVRAARRLDGRPLLMLNGRHDPVIRPEQALRLFEAAREPKELHWWEGGHAVPADVVELAATWIEQHVR